MIQTLTTQQFNERTEMLAKHCRASICDLPLMLGISKATYFAVKSGQRPVSFKTLAKLERAEEAAGLVPSSESKPAATDWNELLNAPECFDVVHALESGLGRRMLAADCERSVQSVLDEIRGRWVRQISDRAVGK